MLIGSFADPISLRQLSRQPLLRKTVFGKLGWKTGLEKCVPLFFVA